MSKPSTAMTFSPRRNQDSASLICSRKQKQYRLPGETQTKTQKLLSFFSNESKTIDKPLRIDYIIDVVERDNSEKGQRDGKDQ